jgi:hypothetical protein
MAHDWAVLLATAHREADEAARRVFALEGELGAACRAHDAAEEKLPILAAQVAAADRRWVGVEEQWECLDHELTLLILHGSELSMTITGAPPQIPPHTRGDAVCGCPPHRGLCGCPHSGRRCL